MSSSRQIHSGRCGFRRVAYSTRDHRGRGSVTRSGGYIHCVLGFPRCVRRVTYPRNIRHILVMYLRFSPPSSSPLILNPLLIPSYSHLLLTPLPPPSSESIPAMGRVGEVITRTWQTADKMKRQVGQLPQDRDMVTHTDNDNNIILP